MCSRVAQRPLAVAFVFEDRGGVHLIGSQLITHWSIEMQLTRYALAGWDDCSCLRSRSEFQRPDPRATIAIECYGLTQMLVADAPTMPRLPNGLYLPNRAYAALPAPAD